MGLRWRTSASLLWHFPNFIQLDLQSDTAERPQLRYDRELGWDLQPGASGLLAGKPITISADGSRQHTSGVKAGAGHAILAICDSYTEAFFVDWHFNDRANELAARLIASALAAGPR